MDIKTCACLMLKNEALIVVRLLNSCKKVIYAVSLTDTGSNDDTIKKVEDWCQENNILLKVFREPWVNFGVSRTKSADNAYAAFPDADRYILLDGDMVLKVGDDWDPSKLLHDEIRIYQHNTGARYINTRLITSKKYFRCVGCTHEYWSCPVSITSGTCNSLTIDDLNDGGSRHDKHTRDKRLLLEGMRNDVTPDYLLGRYSFYLSQAYQGTFNYNQSNYWSKRRIELGGWYEEIYYSYYRIAENHRRAGDYKKALYYAHKAWDARPTRAEPVLTLVQCCKELGMKKMAEMYIEMGRKMRMGSDVLFLDTGCYDESKFIEELNTLNISHH